MSNLISPTTDELTPKQTKALEFLILGHSIDEAARLSSCSENSIDKWLRQPKFSDALNFAKKQAIACATRKLSNSFLKSVTVLEELMLDSENVATSHRIRCCELVMNNVLKLQEIDSLETRLTSLEVTLYEQ